MKVIGKKRENRNDLKVRILDYSRDAFGRNGIKDVTMDSIAGALSISKRTLYEIFSDKEELLLEIIKIHTTETREFISRITSQTDDVLDIIFKLYERNVEEIKHVNRRFFEDMYRYPSVVRYLQFSREEMVTFTMHCFNKGIEQGLFVSGVNYDIIRLVMVEEMEMLLKSKLSERYTILELYSNVVFMHMRGVATEKGLKIVDEFFCKMKSTFC